MNPEIVNKRITVAGRVQGVFYRASTFDKALQLGVAGYVKNQVDGTVLIEAEGSESQVDLLIIWCRNGPTYARVDDVQVEEGEVMEYENFEIRH